MTADNDEARYTPNASSLPDQTVLSPETIDDLACKHSITVSNNSLFPFVLDIEQLVLAKADQANQARIAELEARIVSIRDVEITEQPEWEMYETNRPIWKAYLTRACNEALQSAPVSEAPSQDAKHLAMFDALNFGTGAYRRNQDGSTTHIPVDELFIKLASNQSEVTAQIIQPVDASICTKYGCRDYATPRPAMCAMCQPTLAAPPHSEQQETASLGWVVRERRDAQGNLRDCFIEAPKEGDMPYGLEVLGDDYTGYGDVERKLEHCKMIVAWANNQPAPHQPSQEQVAFSMRDAIRYRVHRAKTSAHLGISQEEFDSEVDSCVALAQSQPKHTEGSEE